MDRQVNGTSATCWPVLKRRCGNLADHAPLFDCPAEEIESILCFRWWTYRKHVKRTPVGFVVDEFLPAVGWAGKFNTID